MWRSTTHNAITKTSIAVIAVAVNRITQNTYNNEEEKNEERRKERKKENYRRQNLLFLCLCFSFFHFYSSSKQYRNDGKTHDSYSSNNDSGRKSRSSHCMYTYTHIYKYTRGRVKLKIINTIGNIESEEVLRYIFYYTFNVQQGCSSRATSNIPHYYYYDYHVRVMLLLAKLTRTHARTYWYA